MSASYEGEAPPLTQALALALALTRVRRRLWRQYLPFPARACRTPPSATAPALTCARPPSLPVPQPQPPLTLALTLALNLALGLTPLTLARSTFYLCKQKSEGFQACELSADFSAHYGENVYVCRV